MNASGTFRVPGGAETFVDIVTRLDRLSACLPGFDSIVSQDDSQMVVRVKVGVGAIKGSMQANIAIVERLANRVRYKVSANGLGSAVDVLASFDWAAEGDGTNVQWCGELATSGKLAALARGLMERTARKNVEALMENIRVGATAEPATGESR